MVPRRHAARAAVLAVLLPLVLVVLPGIAAAMEELPLPSPSSEEPVPSPEPTQEPTREPEQTAAPTTAAAPRTTAPAPVRTSARPVPTVVPELEVVTPTPTASASTSTPTPTPSSTAATPGPVEQTPVAEAVDPPQPTDPVTRLVQLVVGGALLLGVAGGTGLYLTRGGAA